MLGYTWLLSTPGSHRKATHFFSFSFFYGFSSKVKKHPRVCFPSAGVYRRRSSVPWQWRCLSTGRPGLLPFCESVLIEPPKKMEKKRKNKTEKEGEKKNKTQKRGKIRKKRIIHACEIRSSERQLTWSQEAQRAPPFASASSASLRRLVR